MKKFHLIIAIAALSLAGCSRGGGSSSLSGASDSTQSQTQVIYLNNAAVNLTVGGKSQIKVYLSLNAQNEVAASNCTFVSGTPEVASVSASGEIEALAIGQSEITVTYDGISATMLVTVSGSSPVDPSVSAYQRTGSLSAGLDVGMSSFSLFDYSLSVPVDLSYSVDSSGNKDDEYLALEFSPNETASETVSSSDNFEFLHFIFNIQTITSLFSLVPGLDLDLDFSFPGQYKAMGAAYEAFSGVSPYEENFYLLETSDRSSFASYADVEGTNMVRMQEKWDSLDVPIDTFRDVLAYLMDTDLSSVDYVGYINQLIEDGELLDSSSGSAIQIALGVLIVLINEFSITKTATTVGSFEGVNFLLHPKDLNALNEDLPSLLENLGVSLSDFSLALDAMDLSFTIYTDDAKNTCISDIALDLGLTISDSIYAKVNLAYSMSHEKTAIEDAYLTSLESMDKSFDSTVSSFESFYEKIEPVVAFYDGDAPSSGIDITEAYGTTLQGYVTEYEALSNATKFMLTDKVNSSSIMSKYNNGRTSLSTTAGLLAAAMSLGTLDYATARSNLIALSGYKNWGEALKEYTYSGTLLNLSGAEIYNAILVAEEAYFKTITDEISAVTTILSTYEATSTVADSLTLFNRAYSVLCGSSGSLNYFANENANMVLSELTESVEAAYVSSDTILSSLYSSVLAKFKAILDDGSLASQTKLDELSSLLVGEGSSTLLSHWMTSRSGHRFISNGKRADFVKDIEGTYTDDLLAMNESLVQSKRKEGYPLYGGESWSSFVTEANALIDQVSSLETAIYGSERTDLSALRTLVSD